jgi:hypothetical protein
VFYLSICFGLVALSVPRALEAQLLKGRIISTESRTPISDATVEAIDSLRKVILSTRSDANGAFTMQFGGPGEFRIRVRRIGIEPTLTDPLKFVGPDTVEVDLLVEERPAVVDERRVVATMSPITEARLENARSRGWRVYPPERVKPIRERAMNLDAMLKALGLANVMISQQCIRSLVTNGCMTVFIDDQYFGQVSFNSINVRDIEFVAVIGPTEALTTYGNRAQHGVVMLYTARPEDRRPPRR